MEIICERLTLKPLIEKDRENYFLLLNTVEVIKYCFSPLNDDEVDMAFNERVKNWSSYSSGWLCFSVEEKFSTKFIGVTGFNRSGVSAEVGFMFLPFSSGMGYATESLNAVMGFGKKQGVSVFEANVTEGNIASVRVVEKCGFKFEKKSIGAVVIGGEKFNNLKYKRLT